MSEKVRKVVSYTVVAEVFTINFSLTEKHPNYLEYTTIFFPSTLVITSLCKITDGKILLSC